MTSMKIAATMASAIIPTAMSPLGKIVEFFDVPPAEDEAFLSAWTAAAAPGATLHVALRDDVQPRFAALDAGGPDEGAPLLVAFAGDAAAWAPVFDAWRPRQGFIAA